VEEPGLFHRPASQHDDTALLTQWFTDSSTGAAAAALRPLTASNGRSLRRAQRALRAPTRLAPARPAYQPPLTRGRAPPTCRPAPGCRRLARGAASAHQRALRGQRPARDARWPRGRPADRQAVRGVRGRRQCAPGLRAARWPQRTASQQTASCARCSRRACALRPPETVDARSRLYVLRLLLERLPDANRKVLRCADALARALNTRTRVALRTRLTACASRAARAGWWCSCSPC
jgi:hypothetical protein